MYFVDVPRISYFAFREGVTSRLDVLKCNVFLCYGKIKQIVIRIVVSISEESAEEQTLWISSV
jgi:hypothetical protein